MSSNIIRSIIQGATWITLENHMLTSTAHVTRRYGTYLQDVPRDAMEISNEEFSGIRSGCELSRFKRSIG